MNLFDGQKYQVWKVFLQPVAVFSDSELVAILANFDTLIIFKCSFLIDKISIIFIYSRIL